MAAWHFGTNTLLFASGTSTQRTLTQVIRDSDNLEGGYIEKESNLSQSGSCFVFGGTVIGDSIVLGTSEVRDNAIVLNSTIYNSILHDRSNAIDSFVSDSSELFDDAYVTGSTLLYSFAADSCLINTSFLSDTAYVYGQAKVHNSTITNAYVYGECFVSGSIVSGALASVHGSSSSGSQYAITFNSRGAPSLASPTVPNVINCYVTSSVTSGLHYNENI